MQRIHPALRPDPVDCGKYGTVVCDATLQSKLAWKVCDQKSCQHCQQALTGQHQHCNTSQQQQHGESISKCPPEPA